MIEEGKTVDLSINLSDNNNMMKEAANLKDEVKELEELMGIFGPEELDPALKPYIREDDSGLGIGLSLHHPLVVMILFGPHLYKMANRAYKSKKERIASLTEERKFSEILGLIERPYRAEFMRELDEDFGWCENDPADFWDTLGWVWTDSENIWENFDWWSGLIEDASEEEARHFMDKKDSEHFATVAFPVTVYRGADDRNKDGLSWSLDRSKAEWFANRFSKGLEVYEREINREDAFAYMGGRGEEEVILKPSAMV